MDLKGKTAIVTGGSRGIGKAIAIKLASLGANVAINYTSNPDKAEEVVNEIIAMGVKSIAMKADVSNFEDVDKFIKESFQTFGSIDILVNNAGITKDNLIMRMEEEEWDSVMSVNLKGTFNCTKAVSRIMMKQRSGKIINVASVVGVMGNAGQSNYSASKAGVIGFTKSIAKEFASRNINVNAIAPGFIATDMTGVLKEEVKEMFLSGIPLKREGRPEDVANVVAFLSSNLSDYVTGQVINIDGGMVM